MKVCRLGHTERTKRGDECAVCVRERARAWALANPKRVKANHARWSEENRVYLNAKTLAWYHANPDKINRLTRNAANARWKKRNPDKCREYRRVSRHNRRARERNAAGSHNIHEINDIRKWQEGKCAYCKVDLTKENEHRDHILPLALGGTNDRDNIQLLCEPCNRSKGALHPAEFERRIGVR